MNEAKKGQSFFVGTIEYKNGPEWTADGKRAKTGQFAVVKMTASSGQPNSFDAIFLDDATSDGKHFFRGIRRKWPIGSLEQFRL